MASPSPNSSVCTDRDAEGESDYMTHTGEFSELNTTDWSGDFDTSLVPPSELSALIEEGASVLLDVEMQSARAEEAAMVLQRQLPSPTESGEQSLACDDFGSVLVPSEEDTFTVLDPWANGSVSHQNTATSQNAIQIIKYFLGTPQAHSNLDATSEAFALVPHPPAWANEVNMGLRKLTHLIHPQYSLFTDAELEQVHQQARSVTPAMVCPADYEIVLKSTLDDLRSGVGLREGLMVLTTEQYEELLQEAPKRKRKRRSEPTSSPPSPDELGNTNKAKGKAEQWAQRFFRLSMTQIEQDCPPCVKAMFDKTAEENLCIMLPNLAASSTSSCAAAVGRSTRARPQASLSAPSPGNATELNHTKLVDRLLFLHRNDASATIQILLMVFFLIQTYSEEQGKFEQDRPDFVRLLQCGNATTSHGKKADKTAKWKRVPRIYERAMEGAYTSFVKQYPDLGMERKDFMDRLCAWRRDGGFYVHFASRLGLGSLLWLSHLLLPGTLWGMSYGATMESAFQHFEAIGLPRMCEESGANSCAREMLGKLLDGF